MKRIYPLLLLFICTAANAGIGTIDTREYVDWSAAPYRNIVYFYPTEYSTCTAQFVAPDIIITARHCVTDSRTFDNFANIGKKFQIWTHDNRRTEVVLEKYGRNFKEDDWALLRVPDPSFHRKEYFATTPKTKLVSLNSAGFAGLRIMTDDEIRVIKQIFEKVITEYNLESKSFSEVLEKSLLEMTHQGISWPYDNRVPGSETPGEWEFRLKSDIGCKLITNMNNGRVESTCDTDHGDSGGAYFYENTLYAIVSGGRSSFDENYNVNFGVRPERFYKKLQQMIKKSPDTDSTDNTANAGTDTTIAQEIEQTEKILLGQIKDVKTMTDRQFLKFLSRTTDYSILKENYERAKAREQSTANKLLGAAAIGATGIGGMMALSGLAEQNADAAAEQDMRAYLATFTCDYGRGRNIKGGTTGIQLPGGNELTQYVAQYKQLAVSLKADKEAMNMQPGIESEIVLNSADANLYDNVGIGTQPGAFTSLARALLDENSADADAWAKQKAGAKKKTTAGAITAGVGAVGGAVGNLIINRDTDDDTTTEKDTKNTVQ